MKLFTSIIYLFLSLAKPIQAAEEIIIADSGDQPPFVIGNDGGMSAGLAKIFNEVQDRYKFKYMHLPSKRMRHLIKTGKIDIAAFDNLKWSWDKSVVYGSKDLVHSKDMFFVLKKNLNKKPFSKIGKSAIAVTNGFHYNFSNYKIDLDTYRRLSMNPVKSETTVFDFVLAERTLLGITSSSVLNYFRKYRPKDFEKIALRPKPDQTYKRQLILSKKSPLSIVDLNRLIDKVSETGDLRKLFAKFGMEDDLAI